MPRTCSGVCHTGLATPRSVINPGQGRASEQMGGDWARLGHAWPSIPSMMSTVDLTPLLLAAPQSRSAWSKAKLREATSCILERLPGTTLDWDDGAGEEWGRVLQDKTVRALFHVQSPLVFMLTRYLTERLTNDLREIGIHVMSVDDLEAKRYRLDNSRLTDIFPGRSWPYDAVDPNKLSVLDLWWATV